MAINYEDVFQILHDMEGLINEMVVVVSLINQTGYTVPGFGWIDFTVDQINTLKAAYLSKKVELATSYGDLP